MLLSLNGGEARRAVGARGAAGRSGPLDERRFLLVTLPSGPFGLRLRRALRQAGARTWRVVLNGGDLISWGFADTLWPRVPRALWSAWLAWRIDHLAITDLVVFGDAMTFSAEALACARERGVRTWVLENGYNRPDWITVEPNGVNARSCMPRDPRAYDRVDVSQPAPEHPHIGAITPHHTVNITAYFTGVVLGWPFFRTYRYPYAVRLWPQIFGHMRRYATAWFHRGEWSRQALAVIDDGRPFFLACLQREGDSQLLEHSELKTNRAFMNRVVASFAAAAEPGCRLVFKNHPLDPGVDNLAKQCLAIAKAHGVSDRVAFLEAGQFAPLARAARGVVAVNSTAAYAALGFGAPVKLLGRAVFDIPGLTDSAPLERFWRKPAAPDPDLFARFRRALSSRTQIHGSFHNPAMVDATAQRVAQRLLDLDRGPWPRHEMASRAQRRTADGTLGPVLGRYSS